ncbi:type II toxin-antitoxin system HipA family toxin [Oligoflexus tunisiensis]|uniref:type II toxin-antitoxin system HipA family toxin n=1 Tax=Oligoflexus tunisiensis TaxID=708132 RepID=UPI00114C9356|nr:type II toxin-antitoxin system HipA family toxin [Oligoflexus tunisiensis]
MNIQSLEIRLWGQTVGHLAKVKTGIAFEFEDDFKAKSIEISPFEIPLATTTIYQSHLRSQTFSGLPGVIADCLPDTYGRAAIHAFYKKHFNLDSHQVGPLEILSYIGNRSIGALEFFPQKGQEIPEGDYLEVQKLISSARLILQGKADTVTDQIIKISSSAGGRQAKALIDFNPRTKEIRAGFDAPMPGFLPCIIKLDGLMDGDEANYYGRLEYLYSQLAKESGIRMPDTYLLDMENEQGPLAHFIIERFDRNIAKEKTHHFASLCGLILRDYREKHSCSYEEYFRVVLELTKSQEEVQEAFRRALFNIVFRVQDDHTKNFAFLMNQKGDWTLSPAYDVTYVFGGMALTHQMTFHGKDDAFNRSDLLNVGKAFGISKTRANEMLDIILELANQFESRAMEIGLEEGYIKGVTNRLRKKI